MAKNVISSAKTLLTAYRKALVGLENGLGEEFATAVNLMQESDGHVVVAVWENRALSAAKFHLACINWNAVLFYIRLRRLMAILAWSGAATLYC